MSAVARSASAHEPAPFSLGGRYVRRRDIHEVFGGQRQGGISTPTAYPYVFLFTGETGEVYGYRDHFEGGVYWYTGEGQRGHMTMTRGNRAIRDHVADGKTLHLFQYVDRGIVEYVGSPTYVDHHLEERPDVDGLLRQAIVFELDFAYPEIVSAGVMDIRERISSRSMWTRDLNDLRELAIKGPPEGAEKVERKQIAHIRSEAVRIYVLRRANGICESCNSPAPFTTEDGRPYLEPHHTLRVADGGPDHPRWVAAVCPNCHREIHHGARGSEINEALKGKLANLEGG